MSQEILDLIAQALFDKKGLNILVLDVRGLSTMTDYFVIAEGNVDRHVRSLGQAVIELMDRKGFDVWHQEGDQHGDWVVIDFGDVVIHLFAPGMREKYELEKLWREGKIVDVHIEVA